MASQDALPPVKDQKSLVSANLNSTLMLLFLSGMYLAISPASIYIYISRTRTRAAKRTMYIIVGTLSALCLCLVLQIWIQWDYLNDVFVRQGDSRLSSFIESVTGASFPLSIAVLQLVLQNVGFLLADGLMIWRCYHASGGSLLKISIPLVLFISEFGLTIADSTFIALFDLRPSLQTAENARRANHISAALFCTAAATSLSATLFLCYTIYSSTAMNPQSRKRYRYIVDIMLQSSAIYTIFAVILMIADFFNTGQAISSITGLVLSNYVEPLAVVTSGLAPTVMVARLMVTSEKDENHTGEPTLSVYLPEDLEKQIGGNQSPENLSGTLPNNTDDDNSSEAKRNQESDRS